MGKNFMLAFEAEDKNQGKAYNRAIEEICTEHKLNPFHQVGSHEEIGYQAWEMWAEVNKKMLEGLISGIHLKAEEIHKRRKELGFM